MNCLLNALAMSFGLVCVLVVCVLVHVLCSSKYLCLLSVCIGRWSDFSAWIVVQVVV